MGLAKNIKLVPLKSDKANEFIKRHHYSGKVVQNSTLHIGVLWEGKLEGVLSFGNSLDKRKIMGLVEGTGWNDFIELNRMAFSDKLPRNSESRAISIACKLIKKYKPDIKWVISFADACQCGDGTIYRASGFILTGIKPSKNLIKLPDGKVIHKMTLESSPLQPRQELNGKSYYDVTNGKYNLKKYCEIVGGVVIAGYQLRYIKFLNESFRCKLTVPEIPFSEIEKQGAKMYKGNRASN